MLSMVHNFLSLGGATRMRPGSLTLVTASENNSPTITTPAGLRKGDLIIACVSSGHPTAVGAIAVPTGWDKPVSDVVTDIGSANAARHSRSFIIHRLVANHGDVYSIPSFNASGSNRWIITVYRGERPFTSVDASGLDAGNGVNGTTAHGSSQAPFAYNFQGEASMMVSFFKTWALAPPHATGTPTPVRVGGGNNALAYYHQINVGPSVTTSITQTDPTMTTKQIVRYRLRM